MRYISTKYFSPPASVSLLPSANTTTQSFSMEMVLATVASMEPDPSTVTTAVRQEKTATFWQTSHPWLNIRASVTAHRATRLFWISKLIHATDVNVCVCVCVCGGERGVVQ